jgi:hypothetical protein
MLSNDAEITSFRIKEKILNGDVLTCLEVKDCYKFAFIPELQDHCIIKMVII